MIRWLTRGKAPDKEPETKIEVPPLGAYSHVKAQPSFPPKKEADTSDMTKLFLSLKEEGDKVLFEKEIS